GLLTALMKKQLTHVQERGESLAILLASESAIYGRFGYGLATNSMRIEIDKRHGHFERTFHPKGKVRLPKHLEAREILPDVYERMCGVQPAAINRSAAWWDGWFKDPKSDRDGASHRFYVVYTSTSGTNDGYAAYRIRDNWEGGFPANTLEINDFVTVTPEARTALWRYCLDVDLVQIVKGRNLPVDEPLRWMLREPRHMRITSLGDFLWARLVDIPKALESRRYLVDGSVSLRVEDPFLPDNSGTYGLEGGPDGARCSHSNGEADLELMVQDLGAGYLGGVRFSTLARAGRVHERTPGALARADAMFESDPQPWCATGF
ncbi:MAG: GNAT family N-acetyltransferase, partial [Chloroflexi bacterium]